jgi:hypothetical protein
MAHGGNSGDICLKFQARKLTGKKNVTMLHIRSKLIARFFVEII